MFTPEFLVLVTVYAALVIASTEFYKCITHHTGTPSAIFSILASFLITLPSYHHGLVEYITISVFTALAANGLFKAIHTPR